MTTEFTWVAQYNDGTELKEYEDTQHLLREIDESKLDYFYITNGNKQFGVHFKTGVFNINGVSIKSFSLPPAELLQEPYRLIWFKRHSAVGDNSLGYMTDEIKFYVFGLQTTYEGINFQQLFWIEPGGDTVHINGMK